MLKLPEFVTEDIRCIVCGNNRPAGFSAKYEYAHFTVAVCEKCQFHFIPPYYRRKITYHEYKDEKVTSEVRKGNNWIKVERHKLRMRFIRKFVRSGKLFDLGSGWGHFMLAAKETGFDVSGIEMSNQQYEYCTKDLGLDVIHGNFLETTITERYDVVTLWDVLEHIDEADDCVQRCNRILQTGGHLVILVPEIDSFMAKREGQNWKMMGLDHVNYFSKKTISMLLEKSGFEAVGFRSNFEFKLFFMYTVLPWIRRLKQGKKASLRQVDASISSSERQSFFNKITKRPKWQLKLLMGIHNGLHGLMSRLSLGEEMVVIARKKHDL